MNLQLVFLLLRLRLSVNCSNYLKSFCSNSFHLFCTMILFFYVWPFIFMIFSFFTPLVACGFIDTFVILVQSLSICIFNFFSPRFKEKATWHFFIKFLLLSKDHSNLIFLLKNSIDSFNSSWFGLQKNTEKYHRWEEKCIVSVRNEER